jgi:hypothetical protein
MAVLQHPDRARANTHNGATWLAVALALATAAAYVLTGLGVLGTGDVAAEEAPAGIPYVAAACYAAGGLLVLLRWRWLWIVGAVINGLVMLFFFSGYASRPAVLMSPGGLVTKAAEILLELCLLYLIATYRRELRG